MTVKYTIKELKIDDLNNNLLDNFNRYQDIKRCYRNENGNWVLKDIAFIENWDKKMKEEKINNSFYNSIKSGGYVFGAYNEDEKIIAFANLLSKKFGSQNQYIQLKQIHVSYEYRNLGIGKKLFSLCAKKAKEIGAKRIYISANSSEETQYFYRSIGCVDAIEINKELFEEEPFDRHMEYVI
jgi:N-acetylglutamate synthase-like GNAT family acetyltransferase